MNQLDHVIVMGVSGSGKSTVARGIAEHNQWQFAEGDDFHTRANIDKMAAGYPLTDTDRWPWLESIGSWIVDQANEGCNAVISCSALRRVYRDLLRDHRPSIRFCHLTVAPDVVSARIAGRRGHYMLSALAASQIATLEDLQPDEPGVEVPAAKSPQDVINDALVALGYETGQRR